MWVLVSTPVIASSETWDQNLDLTIPSLEMPSTWLLDSKAKQEIMMGYECCYHNSLLESVRLEHSIKSIEYKSKVNLKKLQFSHRDPKKLKTYFYVINFLDAYTTYRGLKNPNVEERNILLGPKPSLGQIVLLKVVFTHVFLEKYDPQTLIIPNYVITAAVANNIHVMNRVGIISL